MQANGLFALFKTGRGPRGLNEHPPAHAAAGRHAGPGLRRRSVRGAPRGAREAAVPEGANAEAPALRVAAARHALGSQSDGARRGRDCARRGRDCVGL